MHKIATVLILVCGMYACVDPFSVDINEAAERYVIEGSITNQPPPYHVVLTKTSNYSRSLDGLVSYVSGAEIAIKDEDGNSIPLFETSAGRYQTAVGAAAGEIGKAYYVEVITPEGKRISSRPEKINPSPPIASVYSEYDDATLLNEGFRVYVDVADPEENGNFYKWETIGYYPHSTYCFVKDEERFIGNIQSDKIINGNMISRRVVRNVPFGSYVYYVVEVYQLAISPEAFAFMDAIRKQTASTGSIFDPPPTFIRGNLFNADDDEDIVLGYFYAAGASRKDLVIDRSATGRIPRPSAPLASTPVYCGYPCDPLCVAFSGGKCGDRPCPPDCASLPGVTNIAPDAWPLGHRECEN